MRKDIILTLLLAAALSAHAQTPKKQTPKNQTPKAQVTTAATPVTTDHQAVLTWAPPTACTDGSPCTPVSQNVYRLVGTCVSANASSPPFTVLASVGGGIKTYTDTGLAAATTYCYYITALLAQPPAWSSTTTYTGGQEVTYNGAVYAALNTTQANLNQIPGTSSTFWALASIESAGSNLAGGSTAQTGPPQAPSNLQATVQ